ncbi:hypothetical protein [Formosa haliotis]|nr:hypothetical protein [Formosa haliotis]
MKTKLLFLIINCFLIGSIYGQKPIEISKEKAEEVDAFIKKK